MLRLPTTNEPPAQEPNQSTDNSYHGHRDARDGPAAELGTTITSSAIFHEVTKDSQCGRWITALSIHIDPSMRWQCEQHSRPGDAPGRTEVRLGACRDAMCASICTSTWSSSWAETGLRAAWLADTAHRGGVHRGHRAAPHCVEVTVKDQVALGAQDTDRTLSKDQLSQGCVSGDS